MHIKMSLYDAAAVRTKECSAVLRFAVVDDLSIVADDSVNYGKLGKHMLHGQFNIHA